MKISQKIYLPFKRLIGLFGAITGILVCFTLLWWWVFIINMFVTKGHPLFFHLRLGKNKKPFKLIKFRSMKMEANPNLAPSYITKEYQQSMETGFGRFLRKSSIDETPQLFNILLGQMAFIGPRPGAAKDEEELVREREKYKPNAFDVKPGLSGLAQVSMNREHNMSDKARLDHEYASKFSFLLDVKLFFLTTIGLFSKVKGR